MKHGDYFWVIWDYLPKISKTEPVTDKKVTVETPQTYCRCMDCDLYYECWDDPTEEDHPVCSDFRMT